MINIVDVIESTRLTEWYIVEVKYATKNSDGDIAIAQVCTETREPPKEYDNSRGFTVVFPSCCYKKACEYARKVSKDLQIPFC